MMDWFRGLFGQRKRIADQAPPAPLTATKSGEVTPAKDERSRYGIVQAIELMRELPLGSDAELRVLRKTLESTDVHISDLVDDAKKREALLEKERAAEEETIARLEQEIAQRSQNVARIDRDIAETKQVRERLEIAVSTRTQARPSFNLPDHAPTPPEMSNDQKPVPPPLPDTPSETANSEAAAAKDANDAKDAKDAKDKAVVPPPLPPVERVSQRPTFIETVNHCDVESLPPPANEANPNDTERARR